MADPSDKNNQPRREKSEEEEQPDKTSKSGKPKRDEKSAPPRRQQQQQQQHWRPPPYRGPRSNIRPSSVPRISDITARALRMARQFLRATGRLVLRLPLGSRLLFVADKMLSCAVQALIWAEPSYPTSPYTEDVEIPPPPLGLTLDQPVKSALKAIEYSLRMAQYFLKHLPGNEEMCDQLRYYRRELEDLSPARPHDVQSSETAPRVQTAERQRSAEVAGPLSTEAPATSSSADQPSRVTPTPSEASMSSSSGSTGSLTEEVVSRIYSPPGKLWSKREKKGDEKGEKLEQDDERKESETQEGDQQPATTAEEPVFIFGQPSTSQTPPPAAPSTEEGDNPPVAGGESRSLSRILGILRLKI